MEDYKATRQQVLRDLESRFPGTVFLTLTEVARLYHYVDAMQARNAIKVRSVKDGRRRLYYIGDIATDLAKKLVNGQ